MGDRVLHHAIFRILYPIFDKSFIFDSYSCRNNKGTHAAVNRLNNFTRKVSKNYAKTCFILKCDIKKYFDSISQDTLMALIEEKIKDESAIWLINIIVKSFPKGLPLGNITSQLFANIYLNELDKFIKYKLGIKYYIRYTDDFVIVAGTRPYLENLINPISSFLSDELALKLHPKKVIIRKLRQGIDFLGYIVLPHYRLLRTKTKNRIIRKLEKRVLEYKNKMISNQTLKQSFQSYLGVLSHADTYKFGQELKNQFRFWLNE